MDGSGARASDLRAPLLAAWQLTNFCRGACLHCCEDSGPEKAWRGELSREEALSVARQIAELGVPYAAFGGGEPLGVPHVWEVFDALAAGGVSLKVETDGLLIDDAAARRLAGLPLSCLQISIDGATAATHHKVRPGGSWEGAAAALERSSRLGLPTELVFVPTRLNLSELAQAYDLAERRGARKFVTGPLMRLGRAAAAWAGLAPSPAEWDQALSALRDLAERRGNPVELSVYPWDIQREIATRLESPQAMVLIVPDGKVKLLNALPFAPADLRRHTLAEAWEAVLRAWADPGVRAFAARAAREPELLRHANECWEEVPAGPAPAAPQVPGPPGPAGGAP